MSPDLALRIVTQACLGLEVAHRGGIVHRDVKPANLFLASGDREEIVVKLLDFGVAKVKMEQLHGTGAESTGLTRTGSMLGSPHYMAPEQAYGLKNIDQRADVWSLGVVLYKALTGRTPHEGAGSLAQRSVLPIGPRAPKTSRSETSVRRPMPWRRSSATSPSRRNVREGATSAAKGPGATCCVWPWRQRGDHVP